MRKIIFAAAVLTASLTAAACGSSTSPSSTLSVTPTTQAAPSSNPDQAYLNELSTNSDFNGLPSSGLIGLGQAACADLNGGSTPLQVAQDGVNAINNNPGLGLTYSDIGFLIGAATVAYCPQYTNEMRAWAASVSQ